MMTGNMKSIILFVVAGRSINRFRVIVEKGSIVKRVVFLLMMVSAACLQAVERRPNIVLILTDDMGYGDVSFLNPESKIQTPHMDGLAKEGVYLTDAHSPSSVCTPTRYSVLSGNYAWRAGSSARGVSMPWDATLFSEADRPIASLLKDAGYATACIGKWHLGWEWPWKEGFAKKDARDGGRSIATCDMFEFNKPIAGGPLGSGFDYYFGDDVPNFPPFAFIENGRLTCEPVDIVGKDLFSIGPSGSIHGNGPGQEGWQFDEVLPAITKKAVEYVEKASQGKEPFFLYFTPTSPHTPVVPAKQFQGCSQAGYYGDYVVQTDDSVGRIIETLEKNNCFENTLVIVTSDNGPSPHTHATIREYGHRPTGPYRGMKFDIWEGGHRVPFIASWPRKNIKGGKCIDDMLVLTDLYATMAAAANIQLEDYFDSVDQTSTLLGQGASRSELVSHCGQKLGLRQNEWVLLSGGGGKKEPEWRRKLFNIESPNAKIQLFNLEKDPGQRVNVADRYPERVDQMSKRLKEMKAGKR